MTKSELPSSTAFEAAFEYIKRQLRFSHPDGWFDKQQRWYPNDCEDPNRTLRDTVRTPSSSWPYSYLLAARSLKHVCELKKADAKAARAAIKELKKRFCCETEQELARAEEWIDKGGLLFEAVAHNYAQAPERGKRKI